MNALTVAVLSVGIWVVILVPVFLWHRYRQPAVITASAVQPPQLPARPVERGGSIAERRPFDSAISVAVGTLEGGETPWDS